MQGVILDFLRAKDGFVSGDQISQHLKISRQALWKHIQELKEMGYRIEALPHEGYRLIGVPDRLFSFEVVHGLGTKFMGTRVSYLDRVDSTMTACVRLALEGAEEGTVVIAESQTRGRGRLGRVWDSPKYLGVYLSFLLRPALTLAQAPLLTLLTAVSVTEAVERSCGVRLRIKWPNDLYIGAKKVAGILTELSAETDRVNFAVIGAGINVNNDPGSLVAGATSLKEAGGTQVNRLSLVQALLRAIEKDYCQMQENGPQDMLERWRMSSETIGRRVRVERAKRQIEGKAVDIDADGALLIETDAGRTERIYAGDVIHCR